MYFHSRLGILIDQRPDATRLRAREKLADDAAGRQDDRILVVDVLGRRRVGGDVEACLAVSEIKAASPTSDRVPGVRLEQSGRAGMVLRGAGPEDAVFFFDALVGDAGVIGDAARRSAAQLVED